ncbi:hypothetical protein [Candidatus Spongiihabitans sp.]|uniref:hypothetical protein n=1 Tax=Candidatus Spongiihabitans sp. TaxID=3101308 RepID=UPI003C7BA572
MPWRSRTFSLVCFGVSTRLYLLGSLLPVIRHCPAHIIIGRAIQLLKGIIKES